MSGDAELLISVSPGEARAALREDGRVVELQIERARSGPQPGDIYLARVSKLLPGANAAFLDIGDGAEAFLSGADARDKVAPGGKAPKAADSNDITRLVTEGERLIVQITQAPRGDKSAKVSTRLALAGHRLVFLPGGSAVTVSRRVTDPGERARLAAIGEAFAEGLEGGLILRSAAEGAAPDALKAEAVTLARRWRDILQAAEAAAGPCALDREASPLRRILRDRAAAGIGRVLLDRRTALAEAKAYLDEHEPALARRLASEEAETPLFEAEGIEAEIEAALGPHVPLPDGGALTIETTHALTAIDVDSGGRAGGDRDRVALETNLAAAAEAARQLRLRNIAGLIVIDFVNMRRREHRPRVLQALRDALARDPVAAEAGGFTRFGLVELVRRRERPSLAEIMTEPTSDGGRALSAETVALMALRALLAAARQHRGRPLKLRAHREVAAALGGPVAEAYAETREALGLDIAVVADDTLARGDFDISPE
jgi:ribonuclease G